MTNQHIRFVIQSTRNKFHTKTGHKRTKGW